MRTRLILLASAVTALLSGSTTAANAQRLSDSRVGVSNEVWLSELPADPQGRRGPWSRPARCDRSYKADLAIHIIGGAAVGYAVYALTLGIWGDGSGDLSRRYRTTYVLGGAGAGAVYITGKRLISCQQLQGT